MILLKNGNGFPQGYLAVYGHNVLSMHHNILGILVRKGKNIGDHGGLRRTKDTALMSLIHHGHDLFFRNLVIPASKQRKQLLGQVLYVGLI